ncbi:MAG: hypothetical protein QOG49_1515 [Frankiaceae bacterium]|nr:hypothetical protein [Frankiaceae bacterium]
MSAAGDVVLVDPDTGTTVRTVIPHDANGPAISVAWDPVHRIVYFGRGGTCASVWRHTLGEEAVHLLGTGHHPVLSPDGTRLAVANGCTPGRSQSDGITVRAAGTGAPMLRLPIVVPTAGKAAMPWYVGDIDWRPDGGALVVTIGWEGSDAQHLVDLHRPPASVAAGKVVAVKPAPPETTYAEVEFVGPRLVVAGSCCVGAAGTPSARLFVRDGTAGALTPIATGPAYSLTADPGGRLRYLGGDPAVGPAALWAMDAIGQAARQIGGEFRALSW